jgi:hypothetical protein
MRERGIDIQNRWCTSPSPTPCPMKRAGVMLGSEKMVVQMQCEKTGVRWKRGGERWSVYLDVDLDVDLGVLDNADLCGAEDAAVELEALLLGEEDDTVLLVGLGRLEDGLVDVGVELLGRLGGVEALEAVLLERVDEDRVGHLDALVEGAEVRVLALELLGRDGAEGAVEVVDALDQVAGEALDGKVLCGLCLAGGALLQVAEVGDGAEVLVLQRTSQRGSWAQSGRGWRTLRSMISLSFFSAWALSWASSLVAASSLASAAGASALSAAGGASEYHRMAGVAARVTGAKAEGRTKACREARRRLLWNMVEGDWVGRRGREMEWQWGGWVEEGWRQKCDGAGTR